jgi:hypothetical protein
VLREVLWTPYGALHEGLGGEEERLLGILGDGIVGDGLNVAVDRDNALLQLPGRAQHLLLHLLVQLAPHRRLLRSCQWPRRSSSRRSERPRNSQKREEEACTEVREELHGVQQGVRIEGFELQTRKKE